MIQLTNYFGYLKYILEHKKNVFKVCMKYGMYGHAITHDLSKLLPDEFFPYARKFYGDKDLPPHRKLAIDLKFKEACKKHYSRNKHHPEYWFGINIPAENMLQMVIDLEAMSLKFGGSAQEYYLTTYRKWDMTFSSVLLLEDILGITRIKTKICLALNIPLEIGECTRFSNILSLILCEYDIEKKEAIKKLVAEELFLSFNITPEKFEKEIWTAIVGDEETRREIRKIHI